MDIFFHQRTCQECGALLKGRRDQKFCADHCRNLYNNRLYAQKLALQRQINRILLNNQQILAKLLEEQRKRNVNELDLIKRGFNFDFHTQLKIAKSGKTYVFCYDYGYLRLANSQLYLVHKNSL